MPDEIYTTTAAAPQRPLFLTVLCVITFIGSIVGIIVNSKGLLNAGAEVSRIASGETKSQLRHFFGGTEKPAPVSIGNLNEENYKKYSIGCIVAYTLCLVGTILMFRLKRTGFYSFTLGTFFNLITHFLLFGDNFASMGFSIIAALSGFVFVILFGLNLKWMVEDAE